MKVQAAYAIGAVTLLAFAHVSGPTPRVGAAASLAVGIAVGAVLFAALARRFAAPPRSKLAPAVAAAAGEEIVWRLGALSGLAQFVGWPGAFGVSTLGFAYRHSRSDGLTSYLALGAAFGAVYLATGRLVAPIAAHAAYNVLAVLVPR